MVHFLKAFEASGQLPERPLAAQGPKNEFPHNNFNCRSYFFAGLEFPGNLRVAIPKLCNHQKQAGMQDFCIFCSFYTAKTSGNARLLHFLKLLDSKSGGNTRLLHFLKLLDSKNEREHETVAFFEASRQQKRAGT